MQTEAGRLSYRRIKYARKIFLLILAAGIALLFYSCLSSSTKIDYGDQGQPKKCTVMISSDLEVTAFDGQKVSWIAAAGDAWISVQIPEGNHTFIFNYKNDGQGVYRQENIVYEQAGFSAGRTYKIFAEEGRSGISNALHIRSALVK
ncbi:MAG: hypothetical protein FWF22_09410 [Treponema sp.]|nr:hypothetical protein [Treponema sp.]